MKIKRVLTTVVLLLTLAMAIFAADKQPVTDDFISDSVHAKLAADAVVKGGAIEVAVKAGIVMLSGKVQEPKQKTRAESLAKKVKGVKRRQRY